MQDKCIPSRYMCDGIEDCPDGSDEKDCSCSEDEFQCSYRKDYLPWYRNYYQCVPSNLVRNGEKDCLSRKDEPARSVKLLSNVILVNLKKFAKNSKSLNKIYKDAISVCKL